MVTSLNPAQPTPMQNSTPAFHLTRHGRAHGPADLLIDLPHGATERAHYDAVRARLAGPLPEGLEAFFFVNTDIGVTEVAEDLARRLVAARPELSVVILRSLVPRTFVDCNRNLDGAQPDGMTSGLHEYIRHPADRERLLGLHRDYRAASERLHEEACAGGGIALALHSYAPRSIDVPIDDDIVTSLRRAYRPAVYRTWPERPDVDLITETPEGEDLSPRALAADLARRYAELGFGVGRNATYRLHPATMGYRHALRYPNRVLCLELRRDRIAAPFRPFAPSPIGPRKVARLAGPLVEALAAHFDAGGARRG